MCDVTIWTDGSCIGNPGPGGAAAILKCQNEIRQISEGYRLTTNSRMELKACIVGLKKLNRACTVEIISDSKYVTDAINKGWLYNWQAKNWRKSNQGKVLNVDLWKVLLPLLEKHEVIFQWVRGHNGHEMNEMCDALAKCAAQGLELPVDEAYELSVAPV